WIGSPCTQTSLVRVEVSYITSPGRGQGLSSFESPFPENTCAACVQICFIQRFPRQVDQRQIVTSRREWHACAICTQSAKGRVLKNQESPTFRLWGRMRRSPRLDGVAPRQTPSGLAGLCASRKSLSKG